MKSIVILGAGFAGIRVVQDLAKTLDKLAILPVKIFLVDREDAHLFHADLYEVATAFSKKVTARGLRELKETVATPINKLIDKKWVTFVHSEVKDIDDLKKVVVLKQGGELKYDYLVVALGSETNYFGIKGLKENSFAMKTVKDALGINSAVEEFFAELDKRRQACLFGRQVRDVYFTVGGGGATGVEMAAELVGFLKKLCKKYDFLWDKVHLRILEGSNKLIGMDEAGTVVLVKRLRKLGIEVYLNSFIQEASGAEVVIKNGDGKMETLPSDFLFWTGGVMVNMIVREALGEGKFGGAIPVNPFLQSMGDRNVFAAGDNAFVGKRLPMLAQVAAEQGALIARNLLALIQGDLLEEYKQGKSEVLVPVGGKFAIWNREGKTVPGSDAFRCFDRNRPIGAGGRQVYKGFWVWLVRRFICLKYALSILPFWAALRKWWRTNRVFVEND